MGKDQDLLLAVKNNEVGTVRKLLSKIWSTKTKKAAKKYNLNVQDEDGFTALHHAALKGNTDITMALLDVQCNVNARDKKGMAPLHLASWAGKTEVAKLLVDARACVNTCSDSGDTPLHLSCQHYNGGVVEILLDSNVDTTVVNKNGESALDLACRFGHVQVVDMLLKSDNCDKLLALFEQNPKTADPPLHIACKTGREEIVVMLLDAGADINQKGTNGTALHEASLYGKTDVVKILLDNGADVSISNEEGYVPLDLVLQFTSTRASQEIKDLLREASKNKIVTAKAVHDYQNIYDPTCLTFKAGDTIEILEQNESGRWKGKCMIGKREIVGYFPSSMVKLTNPRKSGTKTLSLKNVGVLPMGKYEMVTLPSGSGQSSPVHGARPRMSSFGKPNGRASPSPPETPEKQNKPRKHLASTPRSNTPNPIANGLEQSKLFQRNKESLQYVEVSVDNTSSPPTSPSSTNGSKRTQYAEVVLHSPVNGITDEEPPFLPQKSYQQENNAANQVVEVEEIEEEDDDIWVKNSPGQPELVPSQPELPPSQPELPPKARELSTNQEADDDAPFDEQNDIGHENEAGEAEHKMKDWEIDVEKEIKKRVSGNGEQDASASPSALEKAIQNLESSKPIANSPETDKKNYEDMSLNSPDKEPLFKRQANREERFSPRKLEFDESRGSTGQAKREINYENVELKQRNKIDVQSMLISDVDRGEDQEYVEVRSGVSPTPLETTPNKHRYENVPNKEKEMAPQKHEKIIIEDANANYENMERIHVGEPSDVSGYVPMGEEENLASLKSDSYENIDIKKEAIPIIKTSGPGSTEYMAMDDEAGLGPPHDYINISLPVAPDSVIASQPLPDAPKGLTMDDYNAFYDWLESCKLAIYIDQFVKGGFDMISISGLTAEDLTAINVTKTGHRKKLLSDSAKQKLPDGIFPHERPGDIMTWLRLIHLDQYTPQFIDNGFDDMDFVQDMTIEDLVSIGITRPGHQRKLWLAVNALQLVGAQNNDANRAKTHTERTPSAHRAGTERYLETDLDLVEEKKDKEIEGKEREFMSTDIDSVLSRLPVDSETNRDSSHPDKIDNQSDVEDSDTASLHIDSLNETRGSTADLDTILDSLDNDSSPPSDKRKEASPNQLTTSKSSSPFQISVIRRPRSLSQERASPEPAVMPSTTQTRSEISPGSSETGSNARVTAPAAVPEQTGRTFGIPQQNNDTKSISNDSIFTPSKSHERHTMVDIKTSGSSGERARGMSLDSKSPTKKPPPPVKPKSFKKPPPKVPPKPAGQQGKARDHQHVNKEDTSVTRDGLQSEAVGGEKTENDLQQQIKDVFRRPSQEKILLEQDQLESLSSKVPELTGSTEVVVTDEDLQKDQQYTEDLMKDINSMLSDFSTEIDFMFDDQADSSTSV